MRLWSWHLRQLDGRAPELPLGTRIGLQILDGLVAGGPAVDRRLPGVARRLRHLLTQQRNVRVPPEQLLPVLERTNLDVLVLTESHDRPVIAVEPMDPATVAARIAAMLPVERADLLTAYQAFRYAFPARRSPLLYTAAERERLLLAERLADRPALLVRHPYPFSFRAMADALEPWLEKVRA
jgi:hypothetical protein